MYFIELKKFFFTCSSRFDQSTKKDILRFILDFALKLSSYAKVYVTFNWLLSFWYLYFKGCLAVPSIPTYGENVSSVFLLC